MTHASLDTRSPVVDRFRLLSMLDDLARFGADSQGGISRLGLTPEEDAARCYLAQIAVDEGLVPVVDEAGNLIIRMSDRAMGLPVLLVGSHLDSVVSGGRLDGTYGVVAGLEAMLSLAGRRGAYRCEPVLIAFANEEGALFQVPFWGSRAVAGKLERADALVSRHGEELRFALERAGGDLDHLDRAAWSPGHLAGYLELHIEQGPVLEEQDVAIGVVDTIVGRTIFEITVLGRQNHAGTTPMPRRTDALVIASRVVLMIEAVARKRGLCSVSTVGRLDIVPSQTNVIPGKVTLSAEIRDGWIENLRRAEVAIVDALRNIERSSGAQIKIEVTMRAQPARTDLRIRTAVAAAADDLGLRQVTVNSGAGHDAQIIASVAPIGMIFVPSRNGISHSPAEDTSDEDLVNGAEVLMRTVANLLSSEDGESRHD